MEGQRNAEKKNQKVAKEGSPELHRGVVRWLEKSRYGALFQREIVLEFSWILIRPRKRNLMRKKEPNSLIGTSLSSLNPKSEYNRGGAFVHSSWYTSFYIFTFFCLIAMDSGILHILHTFFLDVVSMQTHIFIWFLHLLHVFSL